MPADAARRAVVVNADDLGLSSDVNVAIARAFERGWISSASIMANMPGFGQAVACARAGGWSDRIGVHLNLSEGEPLTSGIRECPRFCDPNGRLCFQLAGFLALDPREAGAVEAECAAQIEACRSAGLAPTHLDSHGHTHTQWAIGTIVMALARHFGIPAVRLSRNCGPSPGLARAIYKLAYNARLRRAGLTHVRYFGSLSDVERVVKRGDGPVEVMVHPVLGPGGNTLDTLSAVEPLDAALGRLNVGGRLIGLGQLAALGG
jgi:predicted glycoside hydrolase/deacetylase ChbG (UPF0249 family)